MSGWEKKLRVEGRKKKVVRLNCPVEGSMYCSMCNSAHPCEMEGVVCVDESHSVSGSFEPIDLLVWVSNQHHGTFLCFDYTDNGCTG